MLIVIFVALRFWCCCVMLLICAGFCYFLFVFYLTLGFWFVLDDFGGFWFCVCLFVVLVWLLTSVDGCA